MKTIDEKLEDFVNLLEERVGYCEDDINDVTLTNEQRLKSAIIKDELLYIQGAFESCRIVEEDKIEAELHISYLGTDKTEEGINIWFEVSGTTGKDGEYGLNITRGEFKLLDSDKLMRDTNEPQMKIIFDALKCARTDSMMNE